MPSLIHTDPNPIRLGPAPDPYTPPYESVWVSFIPVEPDPGVIHHTLVMHDTLEPERMPTRAGIEAFLDRVHRDAVSRPSYWHCFAGINRSAFGLAAYLYRFRGMRISEAIATLRERRGRMILSNSLFEARLRGWYGAPAEHEFANPWGQRFHALDYVPSAEDVPDDPLIGSVD